MLFELLVLLELLVAVLLFLLGLSAASAVIDIDAAITTAKAVTKYFFIIYSSCPYSVWLMWFLYINPLGVNNAFLDAAFGPHKNFCG